MSRMEKIKSLRGRVERRTLSRSSFPRQSEGMTESRRLGTPPVPATLIHPTLGADVPKKLMPMDSNNTSTWQPSVWWNVRTSELATLFITPDRSSVLFPSLATLTTITSGVKVANTGLNPHHVEQACARAMQNMTRTSNMKPGCCLC
jgi:hypothetical protein